MKLSLWARFGKKLSERLENLHNAGCFTESPFAGFRFVTGSATQGVLQVRLHWAVDEGDGVIADAKFQAFGPPALLAAADMASELVLRKNYDQASRISAELIERPLAFPEECSPLINLVLDALDAAIEQCLDIPFAVTYDTTPLDTDGESTCIEGWEGFPEEQKLKIIDEVVDKEIRPYIELDAGGVKVLGLRDGCEVRIAYEGACTSCHSSTGSTLSAIQRLLRSRIHPSLSVVPEF